MAPSNRDRVGKAFELLASGLAPFVDGEMRKHVAAGSDWIKVVAAQTHGGHKPSLDDPYFQLKVMWDYWNPVFSQVLGQSERTLVIELRGARNRLAHNEPFNTDDCYRTLDSIQRLLTAVSAPQAEEVMRAKSEFLRASFEAEAKRAAPRQEALLSSPTAGLKAWRDVIIPHQDVATGRYQQAEFAADLAQVQRGEGSGEYVNPVEFFRRTHLTVGLQQLLAGALERVLGSGGSPVVDLQTNFGGGKTHSLLALYHLFSGTAVERFPQEIQELVRSAGAKQVPPAKRVVLVGTSLQPGQPHFEPDGTEIRTLWGELAWQLAGKEGYAAVAEADRTATNPGNALRELIAKNAPCLILIDEWVAYARQLYSRDDLPAGTLDTHMSFAQALTEAVRASDGVVLVVSIPASESPDQRAAGIEVGGAGGQEALRRLRSVIGRVESSWRPASAEESFEIVRRRLFAPMVEPARFADRDATARAFGDFYRAQASEFPIECRDQDYVTKIKAAYPIHPELFARLYEDWSTLDRFQRTRGVLRLMAAVIHTLWASNDQAPLILPASLPLDSTTVLNEVTRNLDDNWKPIIDTDVDGPQSTPVELDRELPQFGRHQASRRVARTIFLGSAPTSRSAHRGIEDRRIRLGCVLPGEPIAVFGDALRRLTDRATYLYVDGQRYWFGVQPSVTQLARTRAERIERDELHVEIVRRLRLDAQDRGAFSAVHPAPVMTAEVPDEPTLRLVILGPPSPHVSQSEESPALVAAKELLTRRGSTPRLFKNMVVFAAPDQRRLDELEQAAREFLAWQSIENEAKVLNLDPFQTNQATTKRQQGDDAVRLRIAETYNWVLFPEQPDATQPITWQALRINGQGSLAARVGRKLGNDGHLLQVFAPVLLRLHLDGVLESVWQDGHVVASDLWSYFARYPYLPRLQAVDVLYETIRRGPASTVWQEEGFATADAFEETSGRYLGLTAGSVAPIVSSSTLVVQPALAVAQLETESVRVSESVRDAHRDEDHHNGEDEHGGDERDFGSALLRRFHGNVSLDPERLSRDFGRVQQEVIQHLTALLASEVEVTLEISASRPEGFPHDTVRIVSENAESLRFKAHGFEDQ